MKKFWILLVTTLLLACSATFPGGPWSYSPITTPAGFAAVLADKPQDVEPGLYLYRNPRTRKAVESFYVSVTGSREISLPILHYASANNIPLPLAFALAWGESFFNVRASNRNPHSVDRGLFQLNSKTFSFLSIEELYNPEISARYGLKHLRFCLNEGSSELVALAMYNAGTFKVRKGTPYSTLQHIARILEYREQLEDSFLQTLTASSWIARLSEMIL